ncbi:histidine kinase [Spongiivirga citrea]|uniref:Tetratricopeptide repeat protein n=1 Tax=Spongiivirga citrea TaxID=1481457 RepID=A0A6M0CQX9_9FLAO|nr:histidine kinase [Spongiivirga citrea]NER18259.1 tetratricopeptide repeat protein [Spongiivirga citrea]
MKIKSAIILVVFLCLSLTTKAQRTTFDSKPTFNLKGVVMYKDSRRPIKNVHVYIIGGRSTYTLPDGSFLIKASANDELVFEHKDIETKYYVIKDDEDIKLLVDENAHGVGVEDSEKEEARTLELKSKKMKTSSRTPSVAFRFDDALDSAKFYQRKDVAKSVQFVEKSLQTLGKRRDNTRQAQAFRVLGDTYMYWEQYDLAVSNYKTSLSSVSSDEVMLKLARAHLSNNEPQEAKSSFNRLLKSRLSIYEKIEVYEGLGDANKALNEKSAAESNYNSALKLAKDNKVTPKITDLNSKLGELFAASGELQQAEGLFQNSIQAAEGENLKRAAVQKEKVADFYSANNQFDKEIELRKQNLDVIDKINDSIITQDDAPEAITRQKTNYKIGAALANQQKFNEAIPFLEESIAEADKSEDIIVKKDATRRLSEVYENLGDYNKAYTTYREYVELVDTLVVKKEQQISQAARFSKNITEQQSRISSLEKDRELTESKMDLISAERQLTTEANKRQQTTIYGLIAGILLLVVAGFFMYRSIRQQKIANNLLALRSLRSQMNPHFIFNALNSVNSYIASNDERNANRYLAEFSTLMRSVLENSDEDFIPLSKEIELLQLYTKLEHSRFQDKFDYDINIDPGVDVEAYTIPPMLLQPYIENAIWHGLRYKKEKGSLLINIKNIDADSICITIEDDGIGRKASAALKTKNQLKNKSKGMGNIKKRITILNDMYKDKVAVQVDDINGDGSGTLVTLTLNK